MRIQLNKLGIPSTDKESIRDGYIESTVGYELRRNLIPEKYTNAIRAKVHAYLICFICPHCHSELYGHWFYLSPINNLKLVTNYGEEYYQLNDTSYCSNKQKYTINDYKIINNIIDDYKNTIKEYIQEIVQIGSTENCPICNGKLSKEFPFAVKSKDNYFYGVNTDAMKNIDIVCIDRNYIFIDPHYKNLNKKICEEIKDLSIEKAKNYIDRCDVVASIKTRDSSLNTPKMLKDYILNLINLESNVMCLSKRLGQLYIQKAHNDKDVVFEHNYALYDLRHDVESKSSLLKKSKQELSNFEKQPISFKKKEYPSKPEYPTLKTPHFFNKKKVEAENSQALHNYEKAIEKYNSDIKQCDAENEKRRNNAEQKREKEIKDFEYIIENQFNELSLLKKKLKEKENNNNTPSKALGEKHLLDSEIKTVEETLKELFKCRNELYSYNIVFDKYRNIVALSTFYEYLMAGRCETLDGVNGAYNIYENELRLNTIITKLDEIKENQFMIYNKLKDIDISLSRLNNTMEKAVSSLDTISKNTSDMNVYLDNISKNTAVIAHNSAVTAYYSKVNAELTNALGFMVALK